MNIPRLKNLKITGDISIEPIKTAVPYLSERYLILGPTGAGKSSFIEAFAGESQSLSISKNQLASYTQKVSAYHLVNVMHSPPTSHSHAATPIYLIDTPGFSDNKLSVMEIMRLIRKWLSDNDLDYVEEILYLIPINDKRITGNKLRTIEMLQAFLESSQDFGSLTFVTTMWDCIVDERNLKRAESNFVQLRDEVLKDAIDKGAKITKFTNTRSSALRILDKTHIPAYAFTKGDSSISTYLYSDLYDRIEHTLAQKSAIEADLLQPDTQTNSELKSIFENNHKENEELLANLAQQFVNTKPPRSTRFEDAHDELLERLEDVMMGSMPSPVRKMGPQTRIDICTLYTTPFERMPWLRLSPGPVVDEECVAVPGSKNLDVAQADPVDDKDMIPTAVSDKQQTRLLALKGLLRRLVRAVKQKS